MNLAQEHAKHEQGGTLEKAKQVYNYALRCLRKNCYTLRIQKAAINGQTCFIFRATFLICLNMGFSSFVSTSVRLSRTSFENEKTQKSLKRFESVTICSSKRSTVRASVAHL